MFEKCSKTKNKIDVLVWVSAIREGKLLRSVIKSYLVGFTPREAMLLRQGTHRRVGW